MFSFFRKKSKPEPPPPSADASEAPLEGAETPGELAPAAPAEPSKAGPVQPPAEATAPTMAPQPAEATAPTAAAQPAEATAPTAAAQPAEATAPPAETRREATPPDSAHLEPDAQPLRTPSEGTPSSAATAETLEAVRDEDVGWFDRLKRGLRKTGSSISGVFTVARIDDELYEELESALLMADAGLKATRFLLDDLKRRVRQARATDPAQVKSLLVDAIADLLAPLEKPLVIGQAPTVMMVVGVNGAGKTTSIGKLTSHLAQADCRVLLAAADTFRAAAREQLAVWAGRANVEIVSQEGADPAAVTYDAVVAGRARGHDVVIADTAGRLPTQLHLMEELRKIKRVIGKAQAGAPQEVLLVVDGNTGQNALAQVRAFDDALQLTGLIVTKLDGTAKGGVLAAIARERPVPVYFIGIGERLEDLQTFNAREFAQALLE